MAHLQHGSLHIFIIYLVLSASYVLSDASPLKATTKAPRTTTHRGKSTYAIIKAPLIDCPPDKKRNDNGDCVTFSTYYALKPPAHHRH